MSLLSLLGLLVVLALAQKEPDERWRREARLWKARRESEAATAQGHSTVRERRRLGRCSAPGKSSALAGDTTEPPGPRIMTSTKDAADAGAARQDALALAAHARRRTLGGLAQRVEARGGQEDGQCAPPRVALAAFPPVPPGLLRSGEPKDAAQPAALHRVVRHCGVQLRGVCCLLPRAVTQGKQGFSPRSPSSRRSSRRSPRRWARRRGVVAS